jgi:hypothetical protein
LIDERYCNADAVCNTMSRSKDVTSRWLIADHPTTKTQWLQRLCGKSRLCLRPRPEYGVSSGALSSSFRIVSETALDVADVAREADVLVHEF